VPPALAASLPFRDAVIAALDQLAANGARSTLQRWRD
jgi:hypothetical protein